MQSVDLLIEPRWMLPIEPAGVVLTDHALAVHAGRIVAVGPAAELARRFSASERVRRPSHVLLPGFVNAHTRAGMSLLRGLPVHGPLTPWLRLTVAPVESRWIGPEIVREGTRLAVAEMLRAGITTFAEAYLFPEETIRVAATARIRPIVGLPVADVPSAWAESATEYLEKAEQLWDAYRPDPQVRLYFAPQAPHLMSRETLERLRRAADQLDAPIAIGVSQTQLEVQEARARHDAPPLDLLEDLGFLRPGFTAVHLNWLAPGEAELLARSGASAVHCPQANARLGSGVSPVNELAAAGVNVALGTDSPVAVGALDALAEARVAVLLAAQRQTEAPPTGAHEALRFATLGGARAYGLEEEIGSLASGKLADCICVDLASPACQPVASPLDALLFGATRASVTDVWVGGRAVVAQGRLLGFDEAEIAASARALVERMQRGVAA
jgi:5-methylthioadenosine/S-adenosylhomocysteine deaminase